jgi:hypothetical protein
MVELEVKDLKDGDEFTMDNGESWNDVEYIKRPLVGQRDARVHVFVRRTQTVRPGVPAALSTKTVLIVLPTTRVIVR